MLTIGSALTSPAPGCTLALMRSLDSGFGFLLGEDLGEEAGSFQRLVAALVELDELPIEADPVLQTSDAAAGEYLLERQLTTV